MMDSTTEHYTEPPSAYSSATPTITTKVTVPAAADSNDCWDNVLFFEESAYDAGKKAGVEAAKLVQTDGFEVGLARGYTMGLELGYIESTARWNLQQGRYQQQCTERMKNRLELISNKCAAVPNVNREDVDHIVLCDEVKGLYKSAGLPVFNKTGVYASKTTEEW